MRQARMSACSVRERGAASVRMMWALWPSFLAAGLAEMVFFAFIDPMELHPFAESGEASRLGVYTMGFFFFWAVTICSSALTLYLAGAPAGSARPGAAPPDRA